MAPLERDFRAGFSETLPGVAALHGFGAWTPPKDAEEGCF